jgi:hypothetical protein
MSKQVMTATGIHIRLVCNVGKETEVHPALHDLFLSKGYPLVLPYWQKVIVVTQEADGVDVLLLCLFLEVPP